MLLSYGNCNKTTEVTVNRLVMTDGTEYVIDDYREFVFTGTTGQTQTFTSLGQSVTITKANVKEAYLEYNMEGYYGENGFCAYLFRGYSNMITAEIKFVNDVVPKTAGNSVFLGMFWECTSLVNLSINLPQLFSSVGDDFAASMFTSCENLMEVPAGFNLPQNLTSVGTGFAYQMFYNCSRLITMPAGFNLPQNITTLPTSFARQMFQNCTSLAFMPEFFNIPQNVTSAGNQVCGSMFLNTAMIALPTGFTSPKLEGGNIGSYFMFAFMENTSISKLPDNFSPPSGALGTVGANFFDSAFYGCQYLTGLPINFKLPASSTSATVSNYCQQMFYNCPNIRNTQVGDQGVQLTFIADARDCFGGTTPATPASPSAGETVSIVPSN